MKPMERIRGDNLGRAESALKCVQKAQHQDWRADYLNAVEAFPFTVRALGLGQAVALLRATASKGERQAGHKQLYGDLQSWLCASNELRPYKGATNLLDAMMTESQVAYQAALIETEAYLAWLKPFAQALLSQPATSNIGDCDAPHS